MRYRDLQHSLGIIRDKHKLELKCKLNDKQDKLEAEWRRIGHWIYKKAEE